MTRSLLLVAVGRVAAHKSCSESWCSVTKRVQELPSNYGPKSFRDCITLCLLRESLDCQGFTWEPVDSPEGICTHYKFDVTGIHHEVFAYFPVVNLAKVLPETAYTYKQLLEPTTVTGLDQCRDELSVASVDAGFDAMFASFGNEPCGTEPTHTDTVIDGVNVEMKTSVTFKYTDRAVEGFGDSSTATTAVKPRYLTLTNQGLVLTDEAQANSYWEWTFSGAFMEIDKDKCLSAQQFLEPISVSTTPYSNCAMGMRHGSPHDNTSLVGWVMQNTTDGPYKCMGDVTEYEQGGKVYYAIAIEEPNVATGLCNPQWRIENRRFVNPTLVSRQCDAVAFDGAWVDGPLYPPGDFSREWFDKLTISSDDNQLVAHTKEGDSNVPFPISVDGCSITVYLQKGCDDCIATGTLGEGGDMIKWDTGFNDGDYWVRKNHGCCTLSSATLTTPSSLAPTTSVERISTKDAACAKQFSEGRWVDRSHGDFAFSWVPYMELSEGRPEDEDEDDTNGRMTAPIVQGSWVLPVKFFEEGGMCKLKLCLQKQCPHEAYANGTLVSGEIHWDERLNYGKWVLLGSDVCKQADSKYACCNANQKVGCAMAPNKAVCEHFGGQFCCDPAFPNITNCGLEPNVALTLV